MRKAKIFVGALMTILLTAAAAIYYQYSHPKYTWLDVGQGPRIRDIPYRTIDIIDTAGTEGGDLPANYIALTQLIIDVKAHSDAAWSQLRPSLDTTDITQLRRDMRASLDGPWVYTQVSNCQTTSDLFETPTVSCAGKNGVRLYVLSSVNVIDALLNIQDTGHTAAAIKGKAIYLYENSPVIKVEDPQYKIPRG